MLSVITQALLLASVSGQFGTELPGMDFSGLGFLEFGSKGDYRAVVGSVTQPSTHQLLAHCPLQQWGREPEEKKTQLEGWNKDKKRWCKDRHSPLPTSRSLNSGSFGNIPPVLLLSMMFYGREHPWISVAQLCPLCPLAASCPPLAEGTDWEQRSGSCEHCLAIAKPRVWYQHCFSHKSKAWHHMGC